MRTWEADDPKAALMTRKRDLILRSALSAFLEDGFEGSSVNRIADDAGVSIKTLYRHFADKDDLFVAVIRAACAASTTLTEPAWMELAPVEGLATAAAEHLAFVLTDEQLALYRVVIQDPHRFPQLGTRYRDQVVGERIERLCQYIDSWPDQLRSRIGVPRDAARVFVALAEGDLVRNALLGYPVPDSNDLADHSRSAARQLLAVIEAGLV